MAQRRHDERHGERGDDDDIEAALASRPEPRFPGFGHPLYPDGDMRAIALLEMLREALLDAGAEAVHAVPSVRAALDILDHHPITAAGGIDVVRLSCRDEVVATHPRHWGREQTIFDPVHYLALLDGAYACVKYTACDPTTTTEAPGSRSPTSDVVCIGMAAWLPAAILACR